MRYAELTGSSTKPLPSHSPWSGDSNVRSKLVNWLSRLLTPSKLTMGELVAGAAGAAGPARAGRVGPGGVPAGQRAGPGLAPGAEGDPRCAGRGPGTGVGAGRGRGAGCGRRAGHDRP